MNRHFADAAIAHSHRFSPYTMAIPFTMVLLLVLTSCTMQSPSSQSNSASSESPPSSQSSSLPSEPTTTSQVGDGFATVTAAEASAGDPGAYTFAVTIASPDTGCDQYADWWEVLSEEGELIYRRILAHSHVDEQPFRRTGGPVNVQPDESVIVRAHMYPQGYGTQAMQGTVASGFEEITVSEGFAADLAEAEPQPSGCAF